MGPELRIAHGSSRSQTSGRCSHSFLESHPLGEFRLKTHFLGEFRMKSRFLGEKKAPAGTYTANSILLGIFPRLFKNVRKLEVSASCGPVRLEKVILTL